MYFNREISWLKFNDRVLAMSHEASFSILERIRFCSIFASNLDEFFMVRVASLLERMRLDDKHLDLTGLSVTDQFHAVMDHTHQAVKRFETRVEDLMTELSQQGFEMVQVHALKKKKRMSLSQVFKDQIYPVLTPMAIHADRPFPLIQTSKLHIAVALRRKEKALFAIVPVPSALKRVIPLDSQGQTYVLLEDLIKDNLKLLFDGYQVEASAVFRITRDADLGTIEEDAKDLIQELESNLNQRKWGNIIRLELEASTTKPLCEWLKKVLEVKDIQIFKTPIHMDVTYLSHFAEDINDLVPQAGRLTSHHPKKLISHTYDTIFETLAKRDVYLHHPYEHFDYVVSFIQQASLDEDVLAIKQTLYRVSGDSPIIKALGDAAARGKQVTVVVELMARFDEFNNINWAKTLERFGCHVIYGLQGYKTHAKVSLVVRREGDVIKRYAHMGTGNYNDHTAKLYTDMALMTSDEKIVSEASEFFNIVSGYSILPQMKQLTMAPFSLRQELLRLIKREIKHAKNGHKAYIKAKLNALDDQVIIDTLYEASQEGVEIDLVVRGICALVPQDPILSKNIRVKSILGRFLEHSRVFAFCNHGKEEVFLSSADWMTRNLDKRVEVLVPIHDPLIKDRLLHTLALYTSKDVFGWTLNAKGDYHVDDDLQTKHAQEILRHLTYENDQTFIKAIKPHLI